MVFQRKRSDKKWLKTRPIFFLNNENALNRRGELEKIKPRSFYMQPPNFADANS